MAAPAPGGLLAVSTVELSIRMALSLGLMGALALVVLRFTRGRLSLGGTRPGIAVEGRHQLTKSASVVVIRAGERHFLLGVSDHEVSLLAEGDDLVLPAPGAGEAGERGEGAGEGDGPQVGEGARRPAVVRASGGRLSRAPRPPATQLPATGADGPGRGGARMRHRRTTGPGPTRMGVIEALRERTVRRG